MKYDIKNLTLDEKIALLTGKDYWHTSDANGRLPSIIMQDGPCGLRNSITEFGTPVPSTVMPAPAAVATSWNRDLARLNGEVMGDDCCERDVDVLLAPGVNIKRTPLCGRNFEYMSEDPLLAGEIAKAFIEGVQSRNVGTSLKHFCCNNRETNRIAQSSEVDERTMHEIYLTPFEKALEAKPWTIMCSYNRINGVLASENRYLLNDILRQRLGFDGVIVSDWGATHNAWRAVKATVDLTMPHEKFFADQLRDAYDRGIVTEAEIDERVIKVLELVEKAKAQPKKAILTKEERHAAAYRIAQECIVLLKNEDNILPLRGGKIHVDGIFKEKAAIGGGGSAHVLSDYPQRSLAAELSARLGDQAELIETEAVFDCRGFSFHIDKIYEAAYGADVTVLTVGTDKNIESEMFERTSLKLPPVVENIILHTAEVTDNLVVVLESGSSIDVSAWIDNVKALVYAPFIGEAAQEAIADVLTGKINPSGKLAETFPLCLEDTYVGNSLGNGFWERYTDGVFVGYRYYDSAELDVAFPFGYGLSYANFEYSDLEITKKTELDYEVSFTVENTSDTDGKEICQLYVRDPFSYVSRPLKELKGFDKIALAAGEKRRVTIPLNKRSFAYFNSTTHDWFVENGDFEILIGASSRDIRLAEKIRIELPEEEQFTR